MYKKYHQDSAEFFRPIILDKSRSIGEMQSLKVQVLKNELFPDPEEKAEVLLLIDEIIWGETHAAEQFRRERKRHLLAVSKLATSVQERENSRS